ncbi:hypothetical protein Ancab_013223 [Ancistrocladus abbreviatus]
MDHILQGLRLNLFGLDLKKCKEGLSIEGRRDKAPEVAPLAPSSPLKKDRPLSSLIISTPEVTNQGAMMGRRRTRSSAKRGRPSNPAAASTSKLPVESTCQEAVEKSLPLAGHETRNHKGKGKKLDAYVKKSPISVPSSSEKSRGTSLCNLEKNSGAAPTSSRPRGTQRQQRSAPAGVVNITPQAVADA